MPRLVIEKGPLKGKSIRVSKTSAILVGRGADADLQLKDAMASRKHFCVEFKKGDFYIIDRDSANGTYLNGERVQEHTIEIGDKIQAGEVLLSFMTDATTIKHDTVTGQEIAGYLIKERVGRGAMGTVYKATQLSLDRSVALKILAKELLRDRNFIDMFVREAQNAGQLNHPNIVQVYDVGEYKGIYYYSMEYMAEGSIYELVNREGAIPSERAIRIAADSARGLCYAEKRAIVHRDIKPENLMLSREGATKIGDLGIARSLQTGTTVKEEGIFGSPHYMAPEQARGREVDCRTDIYALGATMYHVFSGRTPFTGSSPEAIIIKQINEQPPSLLEANSMIPPDVAGIVEKCMRKNPDQRYQSAALLLEDLEKLEFKVSARRPRTSLVRLAWQVKRKPLVPLLVVLIVAALCIAGLFVVRSMRASAREYQARLEEAQSALASAKILLNAGEPDEALKAIEGLAVKYAEFADVVERARELGAKARKLKAQLATQARAHAAETALSAVMEFEKSSPDKPEEIARKYARVARDFPDTKAGREAKAREDRIRSELERKSALESSARESASATRARASRLSREMRFGKALEELARFPKAYHQTAAAGAIAAERDAILKAARSAFEKVKVEASQLLGAKRHDEARSTITDAINKFEVAEITAEASKFIEKIDEAREEHKKLQETVRFARDEANYLQAVAKARALVREHRFEKAAFEYRSALLLLDTRQYRASVKRKAEELSLIRSAKKTLISQINSKTLSYPIEFEVNKLAAVAVSATEDELVAQFKTLRGEAPRPWRNFTPAEMANFLSACKLDAGGHLAAGVYCKELGEHAAARTHFGKALEMDPTIKQRVSFFSEDLK